MENQNLFFQVCRIRSDGKQQKQEKATRSIIIYITKWYNIYYARQYDLSRLNFSLQNDVSGFFFRLLKKIVNPI